jgi:hypothetical protein
LSVHASRLCIEAMCGVEGLQWNVIQRYINHTFIPLLAKTNDRCAPKIHPDGSSMSALACWRQPMPTLCAWGNTSVNTRPLIVANLPRTNPVCDEMGKSMLWRALQSRPKFVSFFPRRSCTNRSILRLRDRISEEFKTRRSRLSCCRRIDALVLI